MTYSTKQKLYIMKNKELFKVGSKFNSYDVDMSESEEHDKKILELYFEMRRMGCFMSVRQPLRNGKVPDLAVLSSRELIVKEVCKSETEKRFNDKYYLGAKKIKVKVR